MVSGNAPEFSASLDLLFDDSIRGDMSSSAGTNPRGDLHSALVSTMEDLGSHEKISFFFFRRCQS